MRRVILAAALVLSVAWPALAGLDSSSSRLTFRDAKLIAAGSVNLAQSSEAVIDREKIAKVPLLRKAIKAHYKEAGIYKSDSGVGGGSYSRAHIKEFDKIEVVRVEGDVITVKVVFWWRLEDAFKSGTASGVCIVETDGTSYEVLTLETGGKTYGKDGKIIN